MSKAVFDMILLIRSQFYDNTVQFRVWSFYTEKTPMCCRTSEVN